MKTSASEPIATMERRPPADIEAEQGVLGSILVATEPSTCDQVATIVRPDDFYDEAHRKLFKHFLAMRDAGQPIDVALLRDRLKTSGDFEATGGTAYLGMLTGSVPTAAHARYYAGIVRDKAERRALIAALTDAVTDAYDESIASQSVVSIVQHNLDRIQDRGLATTVSLKEATVSVLEKIEEVRKRGRTLGVPTGLPAFDNEIGGLFPAELAILAARPGCGKTSLALQIAQAASRQGRVLVISMEMDRVALAERSMCTVASVDGVKIRTGRVDDDDCRKLVGAASWLSENCDVEILDKTRTTASEIRTVARTKAREDAGLRLLIVDYIGLVTPVDPRANRNVQIGQIVADLKRTARELQIPVLACCQMNRETEKSTGKPKLSHLRDSGDLEQDADAVIFIHREDLARPDDPDLRNKALLIVAKNRNAPTGELGLSWNPRLTCFSTAEEEEGTFTF